jgi:hypothetical protein
MNDPLAYQANPETRGTAPVLIFEDDGGLPPVGTKATPRPPDRPREVPPASSSPGLFQVFESAEPPSSA